MSQPPWMRAAAGANVYDQESGRVLPTIYERTTALGQQHGAVNLGQGFPDQEGPAWLRQLAAEAVGTDAGPSNQYPPGMGFPWFREAVADHQRRWYGVALDPQTQVMHTTGATEAITASILALAEPGSEILTFEPFYDSYGAVAALAGAELRTVPLRAPGFRPDTAALEAAVTARTSMILVNTPHNPTGTVFTEAELETIVDIARRHDLVVMADEVYEHLVLPGADSSHRTILSIPGAEEVAVAVGSVGKSFAVTGWKVGWLTGSADLVNRVRGVKQFLSFCSGPAYQFAAAEGLRDDHGFFAQNRDALGAGRDQLTEGLAGAGFAPFAAEAGYFVLADVRPVTDLTAAEFAVQLAQEAGVAAIPVSSLTLPATQQDRGDELNHLLRFAFCKRPETLAEALNRLASWSSSR
ncbi:aminotransferase class I/II-fold pyridoxal phosphate-dependent enzyme [Nesterenkonia sp. NBAIMH1]|uniref:aminotransferase class I/II-fold pyridoxal phosphate-dependent enzyme n=1 Tax=Nesterenkonia sp. NBAIMH1 TaxID=2600320 RepID=UPI001FEDDE10|nr:aminotransferase class I/II-fold pyridoxal phosphate-dependent enzyme [Nesterenkonia sp. NBAIMH1]